MPMNSSLQYSAKFTPLSTTPSTIYSNNMNDDEKKLAADILRKALGTNKMVTFYLALMRAVKLRLEVEKISNGTPDKEKK